MVTSIRAPSLISASSGCCQISRPLIPPLSANATSGITISAPFGARVRRLSANCAARASQACPVMTASGPWHKGCAAVLCCNIAFAEPNRSQHANEHPSKRCMMIVLSVPEYILTNAAGWCEGATFKTLQVLPKHYQKSHFSPLKKGNSSPVPGGSSRPISAATQPQAVPVYRHRWQAGPYVEA